MIKIYFKMKQFVFEITSVQAFIIIFYKSVKVEMLCYYQTNG